MSVILKDIEIPACCEDCRFRVNESLTNVPDWICLINQWPVFYCVKSKESNLYQKRRFKADMQNCPLIEIPKDADLIDRNELLDLYSGTELENYNVKFSVVRQNILDTPTVFKEGE